MELNDYEDVGNDEHKTIHYNQGVPITYTLGPFQTHLDLGIWIGKVGGEIRGEVYLSLDWKTDLSIDVNYRIYLYEEDDEDNKDLDGETAGTLKVPAKIGDNRKVLDQKVTNTREGVDLDYVHLRIDIANEPSV